ncbi:hypothetical protein JCM24511_00373 [Saitozyma sp. JCM 24511]|nr:hypothetical protein JCM24511_00373 [Saitozyma sp. JCM 24511]
MSTACQHGHYPGCLCAHHRVLNELSGEIFTHERGPPTAEATAAINSLSSSYGERRGIVERLEKSAGGRELSRKACRDATSHLWFEQDGTERTDSSESSGPEANALSPGTEEVEEFERARNAAREIVARSLRRPEPAYIIEIEEIEDVEDLEDLDAQGEPAAEGEPDDQMVIYEVRDASVYEAAPVDPAYDADSDDEVQDALSADRSSFNTLAAD